VAYKIVIFYNQYTQGWTETFYTSQTMTFQSFSQPPWTGLFANSIAMRAANTSIYGARWTNESNARVNFSQLFNQYTSVASTPGSEPSSLDWCIKLLCQTEQSRHIFIRGLYAPWVTRNSAGQSVPTAQLLQAFQNYLTSIVACQLQVKLLENPILFPALPQAQVLSIAPNPANAEQSLLTLSASLGLPISPPLYVRFLKIPRNDIPGFPVKCQVLGLSGAGNTIITVPWRFRASSTPFAPQQMQVVQQLYTYSNIMQSSSLSPTWQTISFNERKTGKAFGVPRGRTRVAVSRR
jgi:hypothetical protein